jgi:methylenetetrahydrofolate--tRNA-(uracil-5-)-methyltransferase
MTIKEPVHVIGGGLAGSEAAWQLARYGVPTVIHEMRPLVTTKAHRTDGFVELVCSNSFRSDDHEANAVGVLHEEMRRCNSLIMQQADLTKVPAGTALAVDRDSFSKNIGKILENEPLIDIQRAEVSPSDVSQWTNVIIASGPLTSDALALEIQKMTGEHSLAFFDAIAPVVYRESIDFTKAWFQSRYDKGTDQEGDYINCPLNKKEYESFISSILLAEATDFKDWEKNTPYFEGCMPIEEIARRGPETLRFGPMKPVGLNNPHTKEAPHAVVQLRQDNSSGTLYNMVGFQTKARHAHQIDIFRAIPGLERAEFARLGGLHRNTFINSPTLLDLTLKLKTDHRIRFAGQITGVEGYIESAAIGLLAARFAASDYLETDYVLPPRTTALGSLVSYITGEASHDTFQPMNINFGLFPELEEVITIKGKPRRLKGRDRKAAMSSRALRDIQLWQNS